MGLIKPITISLSPNTQKDYIWLALKLIFCTWKWKKGMATEELEIQFRKELGLKDEANKKATEIEVDKHKIVVTKFNFKMEKKKDSSTNETK